MNASIVSTPLTNEQIREHIATFLCERFDIPKDKIHDETPLRDLGIDSILMLDIMLDIEDRFGLKLTDLNMPSNPKIIDFVDLIRRHLPASGAAA